jgi:hypothetical protein
VGVLEFERQNYVTFRVLVIGVFPAEIPKVCVGHILAGSVLAVSTRGGVLYARSFHVVECDAGGAAMAAFPRKSVSYLLTCFHKHGRASISSKVSGLRWRTLFLFQP